MTQDKSIALLKFALAELEGLYSTQTTVYNPYFGKSKKFATARQTMIEINDFLLELGEGYQTNWFREWCEAERPGEPTEERSFSDEYVDHALIPDEDNEPGSDYIMVKNSCWISIATVVLYIRVNDDGSVIIEAWRPGHSNSPIEIMEVSL